MYNTEQLLLWTSIQPPMGETFEGLGRSPYCCTLRREVCRDVPSSSGRTVDGSGRVAGWDITSCYLFSEISVKKNGHQPGIAHFRSKDVGEVERVRKSGRRDPGIFSSLFQMG